MYVVVVAKSPGEKCFSQTCRKCKNLNIGQAIRAQYQDNKMGSGKLHVAIILMRTCIDTKLLSVSPRNPFGTIRESLKTIPRVKEENEDILAGKVKNHCNTPNSKGTRNNHEN